MSHLREKMKNSRLLRVLRTLSPADLRQFADFVASPYFNKHKRLPKLLKLIVAHAPDYNSPKLTEAFLFEKLFPGEPFRIQRMRDDLSLLYRLLKQFLAHQFLAKDNFQEELGYLEQLVERNELHVFGLQARAMEQQLDQAPDRSWIHYRQRFQLANLVNQAYGLQQHRKTDNSLQQKLDALDIYYLSIKLKESCEAFNRKFVLNTEVKLHLLAEIETLMEDQHAPFHEVPVLQLYYRIYRSFQAGNETTFDQMQQALEEVAPILPRSEARAAYKFAQNFCIRRINRGEQAYQQRLFGLYQKLLSSGIILQQEVLAHSDFKNIVTLALRLNEINWTKDFIENYGPIINAAHRTNALGYAEALFLAESGQKRLAIRKLNEVNFSDVFYDLSARHLLARTYWEEGEEEALRYHLNAFLLFLRRAREISPAKKQDHFNFVRILKSMLDWQERSIVWSAKRQQEQLEKLKVRVKEAQALSYREWLASELEKM